MSLPINFDLRNLYVPNTPQFQLPEVHTDLLILRDALNNFAGLFSAAFAINVTGPTTVATIVGQNNQGTDQPALEITRSTDTNGYSTLEFSNAAGLRRLEILATGTSAGYGIPANQSGLNAQTGFTISTNDIARISVSDLAVNVIPPLITINNIYTGNDRGIFFTASVGDFSVGIFGVLGELRFTAGSATRARIKSTGQLRLQPLAADPAGLEDGDMWYNSTTGTFRRRRAGVTENFA